MSYSSKKRIAPTASEGILSLHDIIYIRQDPTKTVLFYLLSVLSFGIVYAVAFNFTGIMKWLKYSLAEGINQATHFYVINWDDTEIILPKEDIKIYDFDKSAVVIKAGFKNRGLTYAYSNDNRAFSAVEFPIYRSFQEIRNKFLWGILEEEVPKIREVYGQCEINFLVPSHFNLFLKETFQPFFIFQILSITIWNMTDYYIFAEVIAVISISTAIVNLITVRKNLERVRELVFFRSQVDLFRREKGKYTRMSDVPSSQIIPGDLLVIKDHFRMPCDCVLLNGQVLVDECALTGESVPMPKFCIPDNSDKYIANLHKAYTLCEGTTIVQKLGQQNVEILALVIRTGFSTLRGQLVRGILYPKASSLKFHRDSYYLILVLLIIALAGFGIVIPILLENSTADGLTTFDIWKYLLGMLTSAIPASLPIALTIATSFSLIRYRRNEINCISPKRIIAAGRVDCVCFDKTGTLTYEDMDIRGYKVSSNGVFKEFIMPGFDKSTYLNSEDKISVFRALSIMGTCHNVAISTEGGGRTMLGDPMEIKMIQFSGYMDIEPKKRDVLYAMHNSVRDLVYNIYRRYEFLSEVGRMSVIAQAEGRKEARVYTKGAPEIIKTLCDPVSIPKNYDERLADYTILGYRVLALAWRDLTKSESQKKFQDLERERAEKNLKFVGFLIFENMLKSDSRDVIASLNHAKIESKIVTGDNPITAVHVGREISILQHDNIVYVCDIVENKSEFYLQFKKLQGRDSMLLSKFKGANNADKSPRHGKNAHGHVETIDSENVFGGEMVNITGFIQQQRTSNGIKLEVAEAIVPSIPKGPHIQYAFTGKAFEFLFANSVDHEKDLSEWKLRTILLRAKIYSRMQPNHKSSLIEMIQSTGRMVAMVGDGANDCGALQAADVGLSLSQTEASISAPLTSKDGSLTAILDVLGEGRCILSTNVIIFKFMTFYGILQYTNSLLLMTNIDSMNNSEFLWQDLGLVAPAAAAMAWTEPYDQLEDDLPAGSLFTLRCILSMAGAWIFQAVGQYIIFNLTSTANPGNTQDTSGTISSTQAAALFSFSLLLFLGAIISYNVAKPFRQPITSNLYLCGLILIHFCLVVLLTVFEWVRQNFYNMPDSNSYTPILVRETVGISFLFALVIGLYESFFVNMGIRYLERMFEERRKAKEAKKLYGLVEKTGLIKQTTLNK